MIENKASLIKITAVLLQRQSIIGRNTGKLRRDEEPQNLYHKAVVYLSDMLI
jgi:hypothetical protein